MNTILVAYDDNRVIGSDGKIPWHIPQDFKNFKERTKGNSIVMGRKTWDSLPIKPLPGRANFVLSKTPHKILTNRFMKKYENVGVCTFESFKVITQLAKKENIFVIGGSFIYNLFLQDGLVDKIIASHVFGEYSGDTYFPELDDSWSKPKVIKKYDQFEELEFVRK